MLLEDASCLWAQQSCRVGLQAVCPVAAATLASDKQAGSHEGTRTQQPCVRACVLQHRQSSYVIQPLMMLGAWEVVSGTVAEVLLLTQ